MEQQDKPKRFPLTKEEAQFRKSELSDTDGSYLVDYKLILTLRKSTDINPSYPGNNFEGRLILNIKYYGKTAKDIFLNFTGEVHSVTINGNVIPTNHVDKRLYLDHTKLMLSGACNTVVILFSTKYDKSGHGLHHFIDPIDKKEYLYTQFEPYDCNLVFPVFDQPDLKATLDLALVAPEDWILLSNEKEKFDKKLDKDTIEKDEEVREYLNNVIHLSTEETDYLFNSILEKKYHISKFNTTSRLSSYLYAICAGPYYCITDPFNYKVPMRIFMRESLKTSGEPNELFRVTIAGMEWYKNFFGIEFPFHKYDQIYCPEYNFGAMENPGLVTYNELYCWKDPPSQLKRSHLCNTALHELAHMWFGDLVTMKWWDDLWLNESFATFISYLCMSKTLSSDYPTSWLIFNKRREAAYKEDQKSTTHPVYIDIGDTDKSETHFDSIVYYKGSSLLKQMYYFIGESNFSNGLKEYFKTYAWGNTQFNDFIDKMVEALKQDQDHQLSFDLKSLSTNWLTQAGLNQIELDMEGDIDDKIKSFNIIQTPCVATQPNLQTHLIDIQLIYEDEKVVNKALINPATVTPLNSYLGLPMPKAVILNFNDWGYVKWVVDKRSFDYLKQNMFNKVHDALTRQLFYASIFEMTRDAKIACTEYIDIINALLEKETDCDIISNNLRNIAGVISHYLPLKCYPKYSDILFELVLKLIANNILDKEIIVNLLEIIVLFAYSENNIAFLKDWLVTGPYVIHDNARLDIPSDYLSQDVRFTIAVLYHSSRLASLEEKSQILDKEIERDHNSDRSVRARCRCKAALPDPLIKKELWNMFINNPDAESLYNMKSYMSSFALIQQLDLVEDFLKEQFFSDVLKIGNKERFYTDAFLGYCAPSYFVNEDIIQLLEKKAEEAVAYDALRRRLLELAADMREYLQIQNLAEAYLNINCL